MVIMTTMLRPTNVTLRPDSDLVCSSRGYFLSDVCLDVPHPNTAVFRARLHGPAGAKVWVRAWLSSESDGTLAEVASDCLDVGELVTLTLTLDDVHTPENAYMRIESAPLVTEHVVAIKLPTNVPA
jgi:hypothetical protein